MNLPNKITMLRITLVPFFLFIFLARPTTDILNAWLALILFVVAAVTDAVDGYLARKLGLVTNLGKLIDPLADKLLACSALIAFVSTGHVPAWAVILIVSRELYISGLRQLSLEQGFVLSASESGKIKTVLQMTLIIYILLPPPFSLLVFDVVVFVLVMITAAASLISAIDYTLKMRVLFQ